LVHKCEQARSVLGPEQGTEQEQVVAAPCCCVASCAGIGIVSQGLAKPCISELSVQPQSEASLSGEAERCKKMIFQAAIREKSRCWVVLSYDTHLVSAGLGRLRQPCFRSLSDWILVRTFFKHLPFCAGNNIDEYEMYSCILFFTGTYESSENVCSICDGLDVDDVHCIHVPVRQACSVCVFRSAAWALVR